jgi:pimeloyl-ACP methyl ester carboxylesterase
MIQKISQSLVRNAKAWWALVFTCASMPALAMDDVEHKYAENQGVKIHYAAMGAGPLVVFIHGFPDFWYSWRHQMNGLKDDFRVVALDTRGYNMSDKPENQEDYDMSLLVQDVAEVIKAEGKGSAIVVGHDWGGAIAWQFAMTKPQMAEKLIIVNLPHPRGIVRELAANPEQQANSQYARNFQQPDSHKNLNAHTLAAFVAHDEETRAIYLKAFENSSFNGMMNYYRQNYPREPYAERVAEMPKISIPVLQFHGLNDTALHHHGLNNTWEWVDKDYTLVTIPNVGHWAHHEAADLVTDTIKWWLKMRQ